jgi:N-acetylglucosamine kinase-like BadF-type ATPase
MLYCGWDGGGTKTEVCLADESGRVQASAVFGPLNPNGASRDQVLETVRQGVRYMAEAAGGLDRIGGLVVGMAGISNRSARTLLEEALSEAGWAGPYRLAGDQDIALAGAVDGPGALLIAGTGSVCSGRDAEGNPFRVGGYGYLIDDVGSGWAIGRDILAAVVRAEDGRRPPTVLTGLVFGRLGVSSVGEMITWLYAPETGKREVAALSSLLPAALDQGDAAAEAVAAKAAADLADLAETGWKKSGLQQGELAVTGSILLKLPAVRGALEQRLRRTCPLLRVTEPRATPAEGAAKMARQLMSYGSD